MPMFDFLCTECGHIFEKITGSDVSKFECSECGSLADKQVSVPAKAQFKGTGFYETDFKGK